VATKRQRRKRDKERRHEYEYVYLDADGVEVEVEEDSAPTSSSKNGKARSTQPAKTGGGRTVDPPSWRRTFRRAAIFAPLIFVILYLLKPSGSSIRQVVVNVAVLMVFFVPFSYFMDGLMYRLAVKRGAKPRAPAKGTPRK
jgi:hypothetical protein